MTSLLDALYTYAQDQRMGPALALSGAEFHAAYRLAGEEREELENTLEGQAAQLFARYLDHQAASGLGQSTALFRCGLAIGLELGALAHGT